jgi:hypothetical protein
MESKIRTARPGRISHSCMIFMIDKSAGLLTINVGSSQTSDEKCILSIRSLRDTRVFLNIDSGLGPAIGLSCSSGYVFVVRLHLQ